MSDGPPSAPPPARRGHTLPPEEEIRYRVKAELRKRLRSLRKTTPPEACALRSDRIVDRLLELDEVKAARSLALFWPMEARREVDLRRLDACMREAGVRVAYPAIDAATGVMTFRWVRDLSELAERGLGFAEPSQEAARADGLDVVVVPAVAVDPAGHRIGYGAGYYDRALPTVCPPTIAVAVAYDWQLLAEVPALDHDVAVGIVVTDERAFRIS